MTSPIDWWEIYCAFVIKSRLIYNYQKIYYTLVGISRIASTYMQKEGLIPNLPKNVYLKLVIMRVHSQSKFSGSIDFDNCLLADINSLMHKQFYNFKILMCLQHRVWLKKQA